MLQPDSRLSYRKIVTFWTPLWVTWFLMTLEGPFVSAIIARLDAPKYNLAAFGVALGLLLISESPVLMMISASIALIRDRQSFRILRTFALSLSVFLSLLMAVLASGPVFERLIVGLMDLQPEVARLVQTAVWILIPCPLAVGYRRFYQGFLVRSNRTRLVANGTVVRLIMMTCAGLLLYALGVNGASAGAGAISAGMVSEALACRLMAHHEIGVMLRNEEESPHPPLTLPAIVRFYTPLALTPMLSLSIQPLESFLLAHSYMAIESLAVMAVVYPFILVFRSVGISYQEAVIALGSRGRQQLRKVSELAFALAVLSSGLIAILAFSPLIHFWFEDVSGLTRELSHFSLLPTRIMSLMPALTVCLCWQRGILVGRKKTGPITVSAAIEVVVTILTLAFLTRRLGWNGAGSAATALIAGEALAALFLLGYLKLNERSADAETTLLEAAGAGS